jgi:hypothetical protein
LKGKRRKRDGEKVSGIPNLCMWRCFSFPSYISVGDSLVLKIGKHIFYIFIVTNIAFKTREHYSSSRGKENRRWF